MTPDEKLAFARSFPVQIGVDTGKRFHVLVARGPDGRRTKPCTVLVSRAGFDTALVQLRAAELRVLTTQRHRLTVGAVRFKNRLQGLLDLAWPEFLSVMGTLRKATPRAVLARWPLPQDLLAASPRMVARAIHTASRGHISPERIRALRQSALDTVALPSAAPERRLEIQHLLARWQLVQDQVAVLDARIATLVATCPEARLLTTIPEVSATCAATLDAELGTPAEPAGSIPIGDVRQGHDEGERRRERGHLRGAESTRRPGIQLDLEHGQAARHLAAAVRAGHCVLAKELQDAGH